MATPEPRARELVKGRLEAPSLDRSTGPVPTQYRLPDWREIAGLSDSEKTNLLQRYGVLPNVANYADAQAPWLARVSSIPPDSDRWQREIERLTNDTTGAMDSMARRAYENYTTALAVDGDPNQELIRISEADEAVCDTCLDLEGEIGTYDYHVSIGLPGTASCDGGDRCRCTLVAID
jgi:hypothetical protein